MSGRWEFTDKDGDHGWLDAMPGRYPLLATTTAGVILTPPAARSLRDALNAYLVETGTAESWELP